MTLHDWLVIYRYRALSDQAIRELLVILAKEDEDGKGDLRVPDKDGA